MPTERSHHRDGLAHETRRANRDEVLSRRASSPAPLPADAVFVRSDGIISRRLVDELMLVPMRRNVAEMDTLYSLNELGARIFQLVDGKRTLRQLAFVISEEFELPLTEALEEVGSFVERLVQVEAVERA